MITPSQISVPHTATGTAVASSFPSPVSAGNGLIVAVRYLANNLTGVVDSDGNALTLAAVGNFFGAELAAIYFLDQATVGGPGFSVTANFSSSTSARVVAFEIPGVLTADGANHNTGNAPNPLAGSINTANAFTIVVLALTKSGSSMTPPAGYADVDNLFGTGDVCYNAYGTTQTGLDPQWTTTATTPFASAIAAFTSTITTGAATGTTADLLLFTDAFSSEPIVADTLEWVDHFLTGAIVPADASFADTFTWSDRMADEENLNDTITWTASEFSIIESYGPTADTLTWEDTFGADFNLMGAGRYRR